MGLTYSFVLLLPQSEEQALFEHLSQAGRIDELPGIGTCLVLDFPLDELILAYLEDLAETINGDSLKSRLPLHKSEHREYFPDDITGRIGCIYLDKKQMPATPYMYAKFTAASSTMSRLFQASPSIRGWFLHLSSRLNATAAFLDLEEQGYEFIYRQGQPITATLTEDLALVQAAASDWQAIVPICQDYIKLFYV
ncbi:hypothetical protein QMK33_07860 [Hymenobacter sp. H14-R3]|uniref:hypothetical protein n=1 Tax=Hymenobacter sp. H14-R3 TaxID=3046308 RepID=UPI0024B930B5|nr:hypothetical protein [Hymenobacter sp. H14-R3]MDJ0365064.1 hypothetical protein [Hymenobacter sp. H14-R3]